MSAYIPEDDMADLPDLSTLFPPKPLMATGTNVGLRRSPRKKSSTQQVPPQKKEMPWPTSPLKKQNNGLLESKGHNIEKQAKPNGPRKALKDIPLLPRNNTVSETLLTSSNRRSPSGPQRNLKIAHVDSNLLSLKAMDLKRDASQKPEKQSLAKSRNRREDAKRPVDTQTVTKSRSTQSMRKQMPHHTSKFVLREARCNDDEENSNEEEDEEDEDTDLSGFIVDDDAEISIYNTSAADSGDESYDQGRPTQVKPRRRLQRGSPTRRQLNLSGESEEDAEKESGATEILSKALKNVSLDDMPHKTLTREVEVIDLTSSPIPSPRPVGRLDLPSLHTHKDKHETVVLLNSNPFKNFDAFLKFSPPSHTPALMVPAKEVPGKQAIDSEDDGQQGPKSEDEGNRFRTPPATPPRSPSKLKSPSKLLSPSKRQAIPHSPHRQSMDAFWDHNVINEWNDENSPKKAPAASPGKRGLARFQIWSDSEDETDGNLFESSDSLPSPCESPRKPKSPLKSPEKEEKRRLLEEKRAAAAARKSFDSEKEQLALDLLGELDDKVAKGQLAQLAATTGGVKIIWSKTLRSTAGRANWKRTVTKPSGSPVKGNPSSTDTKVKVQHFASVELAEKIIDCEDRLVNTLAHEFCHLTNFMISNVRDQPHGASFKKWAQKVTGHLRSTDVASWQKVEVTTKHSYVINHKYLWVCIGRPQTPAMELLNVEDEGCGAEYGRHSKSIDVDKHRCGKCKGLLVQVRPTPRGVAGSPKKKLAGRGLGREGSAGSESSRSSSTGSQTTALGTLVETIELSD